MSASFLRYVSTSLGAPCHVLVQVSMFLAPNPSTALYQAFSLDFPVEDLFCQALIALATRVCRRNPSVERATRRTYGSTVSNQLPTTTSNSRLSGHRGFSASPRNPRRPGRLISTYEPNSTSRMYAGTTVPIAHCIADFFTLLPCYFYLQSPLDH